MRRYRDALKGHPGTYLKGTHFSWRNVVLTLVERGGTARSFHVDGTTTGTLPSLAWSPDGRRLLVRWADTDQWLLLSPTTPNAGITAIAGISRRFGGAPAVQGWCCA